MIVSAVRKGEGKRLLYVVLRRFIDRVLPLMINPLPAQMVRVFAGRLEVVPPATVQAVETAVAANDDITLNKYGRFPKPILQITREEHLETSPKSSGGR
jgi:hypothetical protein